MSRIASILHRYRQDIRGAVTIDWVAVTATFVVLGIGMVYAIMGDDDGGLVALVNDQQERAAQSVNDVDNMLTEVEGWSPNE